VISPRESVERPFGLFGNRRPMRYVNRQLRELVWADEEVRQALLEDFESLAALVDCHDKRFGLALLDIAAGVSLEPELRRESQAA